MSDEVKYRCALCGGENVQHTVWIHSNTLEIGEDFGEWCSGDNSWCDDCEDHVEIQVITQDPKGPAQFEALIAALGGEGDGEVAFASYIDGVRDSFYKDKKNNPYNLPGPLHDAYEAGFEAVQDWMGNNPAR